MLDELVFRTAPSTEKNLDELSVLQTREEERRLLELYDVAEAAAVLARELIAEGLSISEALSVISDGVSLGDYPIHSLALSESRERLSGYISLLAQADRAELSLLFVSECHRLGVSVSERELLRTCEGEETFIYMRNQFADEAYDVFSQEFDNPRVRYAQSFSECARAVAEGEVRFCLLPLEERGGTRLPTVSELVLRNDLKINAVSSVFGYDGAANLKYALLSRDFVIPEINDGDDAYLEIRLGSGGDNLSSTLNAASLVGMSVYRVDTVITDSEGESESYFTLVLRDGGEGFAPMLVFLALFVGDHSTQGYYKNLE